MDQSGEQILRRVAAALTAVVDEQGDDVVSTGRVRDLTVEEGGLVRFRFVLRPNDPGPLVRRARAAAEAVPGVEKVKIDVKLPAAEGSARPAVPRSGHGSPLRPGNVPAPKPDPGLLPGVKRIIAVSSGKGGVGKSTVAVNLAVTLGRMGNQVGLMDADVYGPNVPIMLGEKRRPRVTGTKGAEMIEPLEAHGIRIMSLGLLLDEAQPAIMRGPLISGILKQFVEQVDWRELDYLIVDMPPGTGDAQLSLVQTVRVDGVVMVTTPQDVATSDVRRAIKMFERVETRVLGVVENMSGFTCPCCGTVYNLFGEGGGRALAEAAEVPLLGQIPLEPAVREGGDRGAPIVQIASDSAAAAAFESLAGEIADRQGSRINPHETSSDEACWTRAVSMLRSLGPGLPHPPETKMDRRTESLVTPARAYFPRRPFLVGSLCVAAGLALLSSPGLSAQEAPIPRYEVRRTTAPIVIDGVLDEAEWSAASPAVTLQFLWENQTGAKQETLVRLLWDDQRLYVGYDAVDADITAQFTERDDPTYRDDAVEIFINPRPEQIGAYIGLEMNARAVLYDYLMYDSQHLFKQLQLEGVQVATHIRGTLNARGDTDEGWSLEVSIPWTNFTDFAPRPTVGTMWKANLNRWDGVPPARRMSIWSDPQNTRSWPHVPERFGELVFVE